MAIARASRAPHRFTGRHMLIVTLSFFGVVIAVNLVLAFFATDTWTGLVVRNTYVASQDFNRTVAATRTSAGRDWTVSMVRQPDAVTLAWATADGQPLSGLAVEGVIGRPVQDGEDRALVFAEAAAGQYRADAVLAPGAWQLVTSATGRDGTGARRILRFTVPGPRS